MNIVVTGASRGIGYELVKLLAANKQYVVFAVSRNAAKLNQLRAECLQANAEAVVVPLPCNLSSESDISNLVSEIKRKVAHVDVLINNAGVLVNKPFEQITKQDLLHAYDVNVFAVVQSIQLLLPLLSLANKSHVVNISSIGGFQGSLKFSGLSAYSSSKAALACLTECLAEEFKDKNIAFNCLALGAVQTEMLQEAFPGYQAPLSAAEMAKFIAEFALSAHHYMNGKIIPVSTTNP